MKSRFRSLLASACLFATVLGGTLAPQPTLAAADPILINHYDVGSLPGQLSVEQGVASYAVPIGVPPGVAGVEPELAFAYVSQGGSGPMGIGWSVTGQSAITRCGRTLAQDGTRGGITWARDDRLCLDGQRLVLVSGTYGAAGSVYRTEIDTFARVTANGQTGQGPSWFKVETKAGQTIEYGRTTNARVVAHGRTEVFAWAQSKLIDAKNNVMTFEYARATGHTEYFLRNIVYAGGNARVEFNYSYISDADARTHGYVSGVRLGQTRQLNTVKTYADGQLVSVYNLAYQTGWTPRERQLDSILQCDGTGTAARCIPPITFAWDDGIATFGAPARWHSDGSVHQTDMLSFSDEWSEQTGFLDIDADGLPDKVMDRHPTNASEKGLHVRRNTGDGFSSTVTEWHPGYSQDWKNSLSTTGEHTEQLRMADINGDGLVDKLFDRHPSETTTTGLHARLNTGSGFGAPVNWVTSSNSVGYSWDGANLISYSKPFSVQFHDNGISTNLTYTAGLVDLIDMDGDGLLDKVTAGSPNSASNRTRLYVMRNTGAGFAAPHQWHGVLSPTWRNYLSCDDCSPTDGQLGGRTRLQLLDVTGDGLPDKVIDGPDGILVLRNLGDGFAASFEQWYDNFPTSYANATQEGTRGEFIDMNGDGLLDLVHDYDPRIYLAGVTELFVMLNTGVGFNDPVAWQDQPLTPAAYNQVRLSDQWNREQTALIDINGDGLPDKVLDQQPNRASGTQYGLYVMLNTGRQFLPASRWDAPLRSSYTWVDSLGYVDSNENRHVQFLDLNGDGRPDKVVDRDPTKATLDTVATGAYVLLNQSRPPLIRHIFGSLGEMLTINYQASAQGLLHEREHTANYPSAGTPLGWLVASVEKDNGLGGTNVTSYQYGGAKVDLLGRGLLGLAWDEVTDETTGIRTLTEYRQDFPYAGMPRQVTTYADSVTLSDTELEYQQFTTAGGAVFPYLWRRTEQTRELDDTAISTVTTVQSNYDDYGNVGTVKVTTTAAGETFVKTTTSTYDNDTVKWHLGRLRTATVVHQAPNTPTITRESKFLYDATSGLLTTEIVEPSRSGTSEYQKTTYQYDSFGNKRLVTVTASGESRTTQTSYDATGRFAESVENALGHQEGRSFDAATGKAILLTGPNGLSTSWEYDNWGRKITERRADGTATLIDRGWVGDADGVAFANAPGHAVYYVREQGPVVLSTGRTVESAAAPPSYTYFDYLGRVIRKHSTGFDGRAVYQDTEYDAQGRERRSSLPFFVDDLEQAGRVHWVITTYDLLDRVIEKFFENDRGDLVTEWICNGLKTTEKSGLDNANTRRVKITRKNGLGKVVEVIDDNYAANGSIGARVTYKYDAVGNLLRTDQYDDDIEQIVTTTLEYDLRGNKVRMLDPDMGEWIYQYNGFGELIAQQDAKGNVVEMTYDALGRMTLRLEPDGITWWQYDTASYGVGKLDEVRQYDLAGNAFMGTGDLLTRTPVYRKAAIYDNYGRPIEHGVTIDEQVSGQEPRELKEVTEFDALGRVFKTKSLWLKEGTADQYMGLRVRNLYNPYGYLVAKQSPENHIADYELAHLLSLYDTTASSLYAALNQAGDYEEDYQWMLDRVAFYESLVESSTNRQLSVGSSVPKVAQGYIVYDGTNGSLYFEQPTQYVLVGDPGAPIQLTPTHYHLVQNAAGTWDVTAIADAVWQGLKSGLQPKGKKGFIGDMNADGQTDFRLVTLSSFDGVLDATVVNHLRALADELLNAAEAFETEMEDLVTLVEQLIQVAADLDDKIRQAAYWADSSNVADLEAMEAQDGFVTWWRATARDASGRLVGHRLGNGLVTIRDYDPASGQLNAIQTGMGYGDLVRHIEYQYDEFDNVTEREDMINGRSETFTFDRLDRMTKSTLSATHMEDSALEGTTTYRYDALGNLTYKSDVSDDDWDIGTASGVAGCTDTAGPHAVKHIDRIGTGADCYEYDENGSLLAGGGRTITWTSYNKPASITSDSGAQVQFRYGPDRARYYQEAVTSAGTTSTLYMGKSYERVVNTTGVVQHKYYVVAEGEVVATHMQTEDGNGNIIHSADESRYLHHDALGSVDTVTNGVGDVLACFSYTPFGEQRGAYCAVNNTLVQGLAFLNRGFTGHEYLRYAPGERSEGA